MEPFPENRELPKAAYVEWNQNETNLKYLVLMVIFLLLVNISLGYLLMR